MLLTLSGPSLGVRLRVCPRSLLGTIEDRFQRAAELGVVFGADRAVHKTLDLASVDSKATQYPGRDLKTGLEFLVDHEIRTTLYQRVVLCYVL